MELERDFQEWWAEVGGENEDEDEDGEGEEEYPELEEVEFEEPLQQRLARAMEEIFRKREGNGEEKDRQDRVDRLAEFLASQYDQAKRESAERDAKAQTGVYVPLHVHSDFSLLDGASRIPDLVKRAKELGSPAIALTDHGTMYGAVELIKECQKHGIKPIVGNEMYVVNTKFDEQLPGRKMKYHQLVLAKNYIGYQNLVKLTTLSHMHGLHGTGWFRRPCIDKQLLKDHKEGLIVLSGCLGGEIPRSLRAGKFEDARAIARWYRDVFQEDFYLELQDHGSSEDRKVNPGLVRIARLEGIKLVVTNDSHFTNCDEFQSHDALICINTNSKYNNSNRMRYSGLEFFRPYSELSYMFEDHLEPGIVIEALDNTLEIAAKVEVYNLMGSTKIPAFPLPDSYRGSLKDYLGQLAWEGLAERLSLHSEDPPVDYSDRLRYELDMIDQMGFVSYFLVVWDYVKFARDSGIPVGPGRGSAAGCLVAYCLRITNIDPIAYGLLFERFLNPERKSMPDIDTDFSVEGRDEVIKHVTRKYGEGHVAQIITFNRLTSRAVLRDVARVMDVPLQEADRMSKLIPVVRGKPAPLKLLTDEKDTPSRDFFRSYHGNETYYDWIETAKTLEGLNKTFGVHAAGVVISSEPLHNVVPLSRGKGGEVITQYAMGDVEALGLLKMDFLGLKNLSVIQNTVNFINNRSGDMKGQNIGQKHSLSVEIEDLDFSDRKTYDLLANGDLDGIFQLDASGGMQQIVRQLKPTSIADISSILALYRPGPLDAGLIPLFIRRKHGLEAIKYEHPLLEPILEETYGVLVYQEQIMKMAQQLAGYTMGEADILRRAMGKKNMDVMKKEENRFVNGAVNNGVDPSVAKKLYEQMVSFAEYCFNKSHSNAYALVTFQTAYLKANYPLEFLTALLKSNASNPDKLQRYLADATANGVRILPPSINRSELGFAPTFQEDYIRAKSPPSAIEIHGNGAILFGLDAIKGVGSIVAEAIVMERDARGEYTSLVDLCDRLDSKVLSKRALEPLILAGALDDLYPNRRALMDSLAAVLELRKKTQARNTRLAKSGAQGEKLRLVDSPEAADIEASLSRATVSDFSPEEKIQKEKEYLGYFASGHPLAKAFGAQELLFPNQLALVSGSSFTDVNDSDDIDSDGDIPGQSSSRELYGHNKEVFVIGLAKEVSLLSTKRRGERMAKIVLEDAKAKADVILFPHVYSFAAEHVRQDAVVCVWGKVSHRDGFSQIVAEDLIPLEDVNVIHILMERREVNAINVDKIKSVMERCGGVKLPSTPSGRPIQKRRNTYQVLAEIVDSGLEYGTLKHRFGSPYHPYNPEKVIDELRRCGFRARLIRAIDQQTVYPVQTE